MWQYDVSLKRRTDTIAGLLLQNCVIQVSLLRGMWNSGAAPAGVHPGAAVVFFKQYSK